MMSSEVLREFLKKSLFLWVIVFWAASFGFWSLIFS